MDCTQTDEPSITIERLLTIPQAARILSVSNATCYRLAAAGELTSVRFFGSVRIQEADLQRFIVDHKSKQADDDGR